MTYIAKNLRFLRRLTRLSQHDFAQKVALNRGNIASYEKGTAEPSTQKLLNITKFFNVDLTDFIEKDLEEEVNQSRISITVKDGVISVQHQSLEDVVEDDMEENVTYSTQALAERSIEMKKILEGFQEYYKYKSAKDQSISPEAQSYLADYFRILEIANDILDINRQLLKKIVVFEKD